MSALPSLLNIFLERTVAEAPEDHQGTVSIGGRTITNCETWTITSDIGRRVQALEMRCFRKLLGISYRDHIANEEVKARIGNAIWPY